VAFCITAQHRHCQAARQKDQQIQEDEYELKNLKPVLREAEEKRSQHVHHRWARRQQVLAVNRRVLGEVVKEE